jgi:hypothetical protein
LSGDRSKHWAFSVATSQSTYAYRNGVVILEVKPDMMVVQCGDSLAPDNQETERYKVSGLSELSKNESRTYNRLLVKQISMKILSRNTMAFASSSRKVAWPNRSGPKERSWSVSRGVLEVV